MKYQEDIASQTLGIISTLNSSRRTNYYLLFYCWFFVNKKKVKYFLPALIQL